MPHTSFPDTFDLSAESDVLAVRDELGLSDWPSHDMDSGTLIRSVTDHYTHWLVLVCRLDGVEISWRALGLSKAMHSLEAAESVVTQALSSIGVGGPYLT